MSYTPKPMVFLLALILLGQAFLMGCTPTSPSGVSLTISLQEIDCQSCGSRNVRVLNQTEGVIKVGFDRNTAELAIQFDPKVTTKDALLKVVHETGFKAKLGSGFGFYLPFHTFPEDFDVKAISHRGEIVEITDHLAPGKVTVFDFYAKWCGPCRKVSTELHTILDQNKGVALRTINIVDWDRPVAKKYLTNVPQLPYLIVYRPDGTRYKELIGLDLEALRNAIDGAAQ